VAADFGCSAQIGPCIDLDEICHTPEAASTVGSEPNISSSGMKKYIYNMKV
jgi:hypothetical protein